MNAVAKQVTPMTPPSSTADYRNAIRLIQAIAYRLDQAIGLELDRRNIGLEPGQAMLLFRLGDAEVSATELRTCGYYLGSNPSYNVSKLFKMGLLDHRRAEGDKRGVRIKATEKGKAVANIIAALFERQARSLLALKDFAPSELNAFAASLASLHLFTTEQVLYRQV